MTKPSNKMTWHLGKNEETLKVIDFEFLFWRTYYSWIRWQEDCQRVVSNDDLVAHEIAILHIIRLGDRAKTVYEISRLLNRDDIANIQYGAKKLISLGYIEKISVKSGPKKALAYKITPKGIENTESYAKAREEVLLKIISEQDPSQLRFEEATKMLNIMKGLYEEASRICLTQQKL